MSKWRKVGRWQVALWKDRKEMAKRFFFLQLWRPLVRSIGHQNWWSQSFELVVALDQTQVMDEIFITVQFWIQLIFCSRSLDLGTCMITTEHTFVSAEKAFCESNVGYEIHKLKITQWSEVSEVCLTFLVVFSQGYGYKTRVELWIGTPEFHQEKMVEKSQILE